MVTKILFFYFNLKIIIDKYIFQSSKYTFGVIYLLSGIKVQIN